jgi:hypothetical protein
MPPIKSIAVTPTKRGGWRKEPSPTVGEEAKEKGSFLGAATRPERRTVALPAHRYRIGDRLRVTGGGHSVQRTAGGCKVLALLPYEGYGALLYRVRGDTESFERVVAEADLVR